jgi:hypothetical protein
LNFSNKVIISTSISKVYIIGGIKASRKERRGVDMEDTKSNVGSYILKADIESIKETMDLINELNDNLKRAKTLIDELAQRKISLELNFTSSVQGD